MSTYTNRCPRCNSSWEDCSTIYQYYRHQGMPHEQALKRASDLGCTPENPTHFVTNVIIFKDGEQSVVPYLECQGCGTVFDSDTMQKVSV